MAPTFTEEFVQVDGARVQMFKGGSGEPLLILHGNSGNSGPTISAQMLAERYTVYMPSHPGFNQSERPEWLETMQDLASFYSWFLEKQGLEGVRAIASSMGGWLAAEIAVNCRHAFSKLMLVGAVGIQPKNSEITDVFLITPEQVTELIIHDPKQVPDYDQIYGQTPTPEERYIADRNREMAVRLCWKPYMFDPSLPARLGRISHPTHIVWGRQDRIVPLECGELYKQAIPGSELTVIEDCGHSPQIEKPQEFANLALGFLG